MSTDLMVHAERELALIADAGTYKKERYIVSSQSALISTESSEDASQAANELINLCANNYLGLANDYRLIDAATRALQTHGFGMASVRFICGTQTLHRELEIRIAAYLQKEDAIVFPSCFDANGGIFEVLLGEEDAVISDSLNHASIIDGIRLCKAQRLRYANNDMQALEDVLKKASDARFRLIVTDGVFSMDGIVANLPELTALAKQYDALVMVDDCHATGFMGARGAGTPEYHGVEDGVHLLSGTFGKALGGGSGGYIAGARPLVDLLRQRARPYLFSNALVPAVCKGSIEAINLASSDFGENARARIAKNATHFRDGLIGAGFDLIPGDHAIIPVMIGDAALAASLADALLDEGIYVIAFSYPVVPDGTARIRTQMSAAHSIEQLDKAVDAFKRVGQKLGIV